jgi:peptidoglycan/LPS O-acetylase OafA/YrhL
MNIAIARDSVKPVTVSASVSRARQLGSLQVLRAVAALMVVFFHLNVYTLPEVARTEPLWAGFNMGYAGVEIFFVLSGFLMYHVHAPDFGLPGRLPRYALKRVVRILPFFWLVLAGVVALRVASGQSFPDTRSIIVSMLLLPDETHHLLGVQWTLSFEMFFYFIFGIAILDSRIGIALGALWFGASAAAMFLPGAPFGSDFLVSPYNLLFLFGILAGRYWRHVSRFTLPMLLAGITLYLAVGLAEAIGGLEFSKSLRTVLFGLGATAIVAALVSLEDTGRLRIPSVLIFLGDASYSIYLTHITAMSAAVVSLRVAGLGGMNEVILGPVLIAAAVTAGALVHIFVERSLLASFRR